jgi:uncharacterized repeat protein (TIGR02543 family)
MSSVTAPARVFCTAVLGLLLCASSLLVSFSGPVAVASASAPAPSASNCQNTSPLGMPGTWTCSFDDEFSGTSLDTTKWTPQLTANSGYTTGTTSGWPCYVNNPNTISESGGYLHLSVVQEASPVSCAGGYSTPFEAGMVTTDHQFDQTYGAFEVNAELPASTVKGLQETFWLYPQTLTYGAWPHSGEIDFAEFYSQYPTLDVPYIHYSEAASGDASVTAYNCTINQGQFNTYGIDWQPGTLTIYLNGNVCLVDHPNPATPLTSPEPFNDPFFLALTQALGSTTDAYVAGTTQLPATTLVNSVRAWTANTTTYGVTYDANGATGGSAPADASSPYDNGATVSVLGNTGNLVNTGYSFVDWNTAANGSGTSYAPGTTFSMPSAGVTLYAIWTANTYGVTYSSNGATGVGNVPVDSTSYAAGATVSVLGNTGNLVNTGYSFVDWNTTADGSGTSYAPGTTFSMPSAGVTLYAIWTANTYGVTYDSNGSTGVGNVPVDSTSYAAGATVSVLGAGTLNRTGFSFVDWNTAANGSGSSYAPGGTFSMPVAGVTLYAIWSANTYAVTYNANSSTGGTPADTSSPYDSGDTVNVLGAGTLTRTGYSFVDWNTAADGSGSSYAPGGTFSMPAADVTLYAIWTANTYGVTYAGNGATGVGNVPVDSNSYVAGTTVSVLGNTGNLVNTGYSFVDWNTAANGSGTSYVPEGTFSMPSAGVTLYAIWTANTYGVTYSSNGATGNVPVDSTSYAAGATVSVLGNTGNLVNTGYSFVDWNTAANGSGTSYVAGGTFSMPAAGVTLYAIWTANILPEKTTTGLTMSKTSVIYGAETAETFTVTVTGQSGDGSPQGTLTLYNSSTKLCSQTLVSKSTDSATATCSLTSTGLPVGSYSNVFATYTPSTTSSSNAGYTYTASTSTPATPLSVSRDTTTTKVSESPTNVTRSDSSVVFTVGVTTHNGEAVPNGEKVTAKVGPATCTVTLNAGAGTCTIAKSALSKGSTSVSALYGGDANLGGSSGTSATKLTVSS